jgi:hypothetical protein
MSEELCRNWLLAKEEERVAIEKRRAIEDALIERLRVPSDLDGTLSTSVESEYQVKIVGRLNRKIDADKLQELAVENGLFEHLQNLFRWKPEINAKAWGAADPSITKPLLGAITTTPGRPSFTITIKE